MNGILAKPGDQVDKQAHSYEFRFTSPATAKDPAVTHEQIPFFALEGVSPLWAGIMWGFLCALLGPALVWKLRSLSDRRA